MVRGQAKFTRGPVRVIWCGITVVEPREGVIEQNSMRCFPLTPQEGFRETEATSYQAIDDRKWCIQSGAHAG